MVDRSSGEGNGRVRRLIALRGLTKTYHRGSETIEVLHGVDLDIARGDFVALMGPSGSGKTTLLNLIGGLDRPTSGTIEIDGRRIDQLGGGDSRAGAVAMFGFVFQFSRAAPACFGPAERGLRCAADSAGAGAAPARRDRAHAGGPGRGAGATSRRSCRAARGSASPSRGRSSSTPRCPSASEPTGDLDRRRATSSCCCADAEPRARQDGRDGHELPQGRRDAGARWLRGAVETGRAGCDGRCSQDVHDLDDLSVVVSFVAGLATVALQPRSMRTPSAWPTMACIDHRCRPPSQPRPHREAPVSRALPTPTWFGEERQRHAFPVAAEICAHPAPPEFDIVPRTPGLRDSRARARLAGKRLVDRSPAGRVVRSC